MSKTTTTIAYKGFNKDMTCRDFQYEQGKEYIHNGDIKVCDKGFHACENPIEAFSYYAPGNSVYHQVEQSGEIVKHEDKTCSSKIKIGARIDIAGICKATFDYVKSHCTNENNAEAGKPATAGDSGAATSRGKSTSGKNGLSVARGNNAMVRGGLGGDSCYSRGKIRQL